jgi:PAS domain S-box-containing protein
LELKQDTGLRIGVWEWDLDTNTVAWSDESYRQWGYTRETFSGRLEDAVVRIDPADRPIVEEALRKVLAGSRDFAAQYRVLRLDGTMCWIDARGALFHQGAIHMIGIGIDITEIKMAAQPLQSTKAEFARGLTASIAHELSQPLTCVMANGYASQRCLTMDPPDLDEARRAVAEAVRQADRAFQIVARIRDMSRKEPLQYMRGLPKGKDTI